MMKNEMNPKQTLDCIGFYCPEPLFQTRQGIDELEIGQILEVLADDPASEEDISRFCKRTGHQLLGIDKTGEEFRFLIKKAK